MSPKSTSAMSPREMKQEKPIPREAAQSRTEVCTAPDWATSAMEPEEGRRYGPCWRSARIREP